MQSSPCQNHSIELAVKGQVEAGLDITPDCCDLNIGAHVQNLGATA